MIRTLPRQRKFRSSYRPQLESLEDRLPPANGVPTPAHVVVVIEENESYSAVLGSSQAPYINSLIQQGAYMANSFAVEHPSLPNYLDLFSGSNQGVTNDTCPVGPFSTPNLGSELIGAGQTFGGYSEDLPYVGDTDCYPNRYDRDHNPWVDFSNVPSSDNMPFAGYFPSDFSQLPAVSIVVPNLDHDMHSGTIQQGDQWLQNNMDAYVQWAKSNNSLFILTWDEDDGYRNNQIVTLFVGPMVQPGQYGETINHFNMLRTIEDMYGLPYAGQSANAAPITDIWTTTTASPPAAPSNLTASAASTSEIDLAWKNNDSNTTSFKIERSTDDVTFTQIDSVGGSVTSYNNTGLAAGTQYYYRVRASDAAGDSAYSNEATATTPTQSVPAAPSNLTATARSSTRVDLAWTDNSGTSSTNPTATSFKLYRSTDQTHWRWFATPGQGVTTYSWWSGSAGVTYYFYATASVSAGDSAPSNISSTTMTGSTTPTTAPAAPSNLTLTVASSTQINLSWTSNDTIQNDFNIYRSTDGTNFIQIATTGATITSYADTGLSGSTTYYYKVNAYDSAGTSAYSNTASNAAMPPPAAPSNLTASAVSTSEIDLSWTNNDSNTTTFKIERSPDDNTFTQIGTVGGSGTTYNDTGLAAGTQYYYRVRASDAAGDSAYSSVATATTASSTGLPAAPSNLMASAVATSEIDLTWTNHANNADSVKIQRSTDDVNFTRIATVTSNVTSYQDTGLSPGTQYYYRVRAANSVGYSAWSNEANATTPTQSAPVTPSNLTASAASASAIALSWTDNSVSPSVATSFQLYRSSDKVNFDWFATTGQGVTSYTWNGASPSTAYYFYVTASNSNGASASSNTASVTTLAVPAAPSNLTATARSSTRVDLAWIDNSTSPTVATSFKLYRSTDQVNWAWFATPGQGVTSYTWLSGSAGVTYYFFATASVSAGDSAPSNICSTTMTGSTTPTTAPAGPSSLTLTVADSSQINLSWTSNDTTQNGFNIYRSTNGTNYIEIGTAGAGITSCADTGLSASTTYYYKVNAYDSVGASANSNTASAATSAAGTSFAQLNGASAVIPGVGQTVGWSTNLGAPATVHVYVNNADGSITADEQARIQAAVTAFNDETGGDGVSNGLFVALVTDPAKANIIVENATTTMLGGQPDGVLGDAEMMYAPSTSNQTDDGNLYLQFTGYVTVKIVEGWNWYAGANPGLISSNQYDYQTVVTHELGHAIGLYHDSSTYQGFNADNHSVMYPSTAIGLTRRNFSDYDYNWLEHLYAGAADLGSNGTPQQVDAQVTGDHLPGSYLSSSASAAVVALSAPGVLALPVAGEKQSGLPAVHFPALGSPLLAAVITVSPPHTGGLPLSVDAQDSLANHQQLLSEVAASFTSRSSIPAQIQLESGEGSIAADRSNEDSINATPAAAEPDGTPPPATAPVSEGDGLSESRSPVALWSAACTACFAEDGRAAFSEDRDTLPPWSAEKESVPAPNSPATAAALAVLGSYWSIRPEATQTRRRHHG